MEFRLLGPVEVRDGGRVLPVGSGRERFVLAMLLLQADRFTSADGLIDGLWSDPPRSARAQLHNLVSGLRGRLHGGSDELIVTRPLGYELRLGGHRLDLLEFRRLVAGGRQAAADGDVQRAAELLTKGLSLWRGPALADVSQESAVGMRQSLHEERLAADEARLDAGLMLGRFDEVLSGVAGLLLDHPYREMLYRVQMLALMGAGRQADALAAFGRARQCLIDDLGVEPGPALRALQQKILRGEPVAPARTIAATPPRQLPPVTAALSGRDRLVGQLCDELRRSPAPGGPVVALVGPGGVGKSTVAFAAAHRVSEAFAGGQLYADLRGSHGDPADPHAVLGRWLRALGVGGAQVPDDPEERVAMYRSLAEDRVLVVLDDAAEERQVRPLLPGRSGCATLITSRRQLGALIGAVRWMVPVLEPSDAVELLARIVGHDRVAAETDAAAAIVGLCGQLPLAVCVAGARLAVRADWTMAEFQARLTAERRRLDELAVGDLDVRASIGLSHHALDPELRVLFRRLGLLTAPDWPLWAIQALVDRRVEPVLDRLIDVHLIEPLGRDAVGQRRFRLHDLVAEFARERLHEEEPAEVRAEVLARVLSGWLALATAADERADHGMISAAGLASPPPPVGADGPARATPLDWFEVERVSLTTAVDQACRLGHAELAGALALRLCGFLGMRCHDDDRERTLRAAADCLRGHGQDELLVRLLGALFSAYHSRDRPDELAAVVAEQLDLARRLGDRQREIRALANTALAARRNGRLAEASAWFERAMRLCDPQTPTQLRTNVLAGHAAVYLEAGDPAAALPLAERALAGQRQENSPRITAMRLLTYAEALRDSGRLAEAELALVEARGPMQGLGDRGFFAFVELILATIDMRRREWRRAATRLDQSLREFERLGDQTSTAQVLRCRADLAITQGRPAEALEPLHYALHVWRRVRIPIDEARTLALLERAHTAIGDTTAATESRHRYQAILADLDLDERCLRLHQPDTAAPS